MIGLLVKIAFHSQVKKADRHLAAEIDALVREAAGLFCAQLSPTDESFFLSFSEDSGCARLRATEAARRLATGLQPLGGRLHGWNLILGAAEDPVQVEDFIHCLKGRWYGIDGDGLFIENEALSRFSGYMEAEARGERRAVRGFPYAQPALPPDYAPPPLAPATLERFMDEAGNHCIGESGADLLIAIGPGSAPEAFLASALKTLYGAGAASFLWLHGAIAEASPYGPFVRALSSPPTAEELSILSKPDREALEALEAVSVFIRSSPCRRGFSQAIRTRFKLYVAERIRLFAKHSLLLGRPAILILAGLDSYPEASLDLVLDLVSDGLIGEGLVVFGTAAEPPTDLASALIRIIAAPPPSPAAVIAAAQGGAEAVGRPAAAPGLAQAAEGDLFRLGLALRLAGKLLLPQRRIDTTELAALALGSFPPEFAELALALDLAEEVLDDACLDDFLGAAGFVTGIRPLLFEQLALLGMLSREARPRLLRPEAARAALDLSTDGGSLLRSRFSGRLLALHAERSISPSEALFRRMDPSVLSPSTRSLFYLDCVAADALYGPSEGRATPPVAIPIPGLAAFLIAYGANDAAAAAEALAGLEAFAVKLEANPLAAAIASLARASDDYAHGQAAQAAARVKPALIAFHSLGARKAEARAHRLLGLCALAQSQVAEGADYLANASELAEEASDPLECMLSEYAEAAALLVLGDLKRAEQWGRKAAARARSAFHADLETACDFLTGRISFELGRYEAAREDFGRVRAAARVFNRPEAARRAEIWSGRAAAYRGDEGLALDLLSRYPEDAEALWFRAELAYFSEDRRLAANLAAEALGHLPGPGYRSADALSWASGFDGLEARALGFAAGRSYLADQVGAFAAFTTGLVELKPEIILEIALRTREERLAVLHPQAHIYHYYCYLDLAAAGGGPLDAATVLSKAFKALQSRTTRMEGAALKDEYLEGNRWNREILVEARRHKLI